MAEVAAPSQLFEALLDWCSASETPFEVMYPPDHSDTLVLQSEATTVVIVGTAVDTDPHEQGLIERARKCAAEHDTALFATANTNDLFLFRCDPSTTDSPAFDSCHIDRHHVDLHDRTLEAVIPDFSDRIAELDSEETVPIDEVLLGRLQSFHRSLVPVYHERIEERLSTDEQFTNLFAAWARANEYPVEFPAPTETVRLAAQQYAYLRLNQILCYELLRSRATAPLESLIEGCSPGSIDSWLTEQFSAAAAKYGYDRIFRIDSEFMQAIPDDSRTRRRLYGFIESLAREPIDTVDPDILRQLYKTVAPQAGRDGLGQFYTPERIGAVLAGWAIQSPGDRVLDPCSGPGALTVPAYRRLSELGNTGDSARAGGVTAVDIEAFPLQLTALNLFLRSSDESTNTLASSHADFFDVEPGARSDASESSDRQGAFDGAGGSTAIGQFDATVANPPYMRQEDIAARRDHFRAHLADFDLAQDDLLDRRSDLYCYFLTQATQFLADGARLAWIVPTKWLTADYGPAFQQFLFDHYSVEAVVGFPTRLFEDALVDTVLLLAERRNSASDRLTTNTNFVRITRHCSPDEVLVRIERDHEIPEDRPLTIETTPASRTVAVRQSILVERLGQKLEPYLTAPALYLTLCERDDCCPLSELATITRGVKTGANPIFVLDQETIDTYGIDAQFCRPAIKSVRAVDGLTYTAGDVERWLLDFHDYVTDLDQGTANTDAVRAALREDGYDGVCAYLSWADDQPARGNSSLESNEPWFDLGPLADETAPIICPQAMDTRRFFVWTDSAVVPSNRFLLVDPVSGVDATLLLGLLNSSLSQIVVESHGRVTGGGAINLSGSDLERFRVPDPRTLSTEQEVAISEGFEGLVDGDQSGRETIDAVVIEVLGLDISVAELQELSDALKRIRRENGTATDDIPTVESDLDLTFE